MCQHFEVNICTPVTNTNRTKPILLNIICSNYINIFNLLEMNREAYTFILYTTLSKNILTSLLWRGWLVTVIDFLGEFLLRTELVSAFREMGALWIALDANIAFSTPTPGDDELNSAAMMNLVRYFCILDSPAISSDEDTSSTSVTLEPVNFTNSSYVLFQPPELWFREYNTSVAP